MNNKGLKANYDRMKSADYWELTLEGAEEFASEGIRPFENNEQIKLVQISDRLVQVHFGANDFYRQEMGLGTFYELDDKLTFIGTSQKYGNFSFNLESNSRGKAMLTDWYASGSVYANRSKSISNKSADTVLNTRSEDTIILTVSRGAEL